MNEYSEHERDYPSALRFPFYLRIYIFDEQSRYNNIFTFVCCFFLSHVVEHDNLKDKKMASLHHLYVCIEDCISKESQPALSPMPHVFFPVGHSSLVPIANSTPLVYGPWLK